MNNNQDKINRIKELTELLNKAAYAYYQKADEIMSNYEYDALYDELERLEKETGFLMSNSPTQNVGYEVLSSLPKERHSSAMLSLAKTKSREEIAAWLGKETGLLSWKLDGLTVVLTYREGKLFKAVTRGNGEIGEVITQNARNFANIPLEIPFKGELVLRGEAVISYKDFEAINSEIDSVDAKFKNPRNLCSGSVRALDPAVTKQRNVKFIAFSLVSAEAADFKNSRAGQFEFLSQQGFDVVEYKKVSADTIVAEINAFAEKITANSFPSDGLVLLLEDIAYGESLGRTAKSPRNAIAFKWADETAETKLLEVEWSPSRTGLLNPVAIFEPVELEGTTVSRASVHNISIVRQLQLGIGDTIRVYKANMIIPQISENLTKSGSLAIPEVCPVCGQKTEIICENETELLVCVNPDCSAKDIKGFSLFVSRDAMNIEGLSEQTLEKFLEKGFLKSFIDIYHLELHAGAIMAMEGFGEKSYYKLLENIEKSRKTTLSRVLYSLGVKGVGVATAKLLSLHFDQDFEKLITAGREELSDIEGIGSVMADDICTYFENEENVERLRNLMAELRLERETVRYDHEASGKTFVVTGSVNHFPSRKELKAYIESVGGKVAGSVSSKTDYLINNDSASNSSKNKAAKELNIPIISEDEFLEMFG